MERIISALNISQNLIIYTKLNLESKLNLLKDCFSLLDDPPLMFMNHGKSCMTVDRFVYWPTQWDTLKDVHLRVDLRYKEIYASPLATSINVFFSRVTNRNVV